ncbi:hypothetical protein BH20ACT24_BH20ACT24_11720 [soil metagenome]
MRERLRSLPLRALTPALALVMIGSGAVILVAEGAQDGPSTLPPLRIGGAGLTAIDLDGPPRAVAVGGGQVWALAEDGAGGSLLQIDPQTNAIVGEPLAFVPETTGHPIDLAVTDGAVWVVTGANPEDPSESGPSGLQRVDPVSRQIVATIGVGADPVDVALGAGSLWVANGGDGTVSRVDPASETVVATVPVGQTPREIVADARGVWVSVGVNEPSLVRIDPVTNAVAATLPGLTSASIGTTYVWAVGPGAPNGSVVRVDPTTNQVVDGSFPLDLSPAYVVTLGGGGGVWIAKWFPRPGTTGASDRDAEPFSGAFEVFRLDPRSMTIATRPLVIDAAPTRPSPGLGALWVPSRVARAVLRVDPSLVDPA